MKFIALIFLAVSVLPPPAKSGPDRPNFLVILADDMGYSDLGCFGSGIDTPNLDALAKNGIRYTQMYNTSKCYPTRASLLTGVYFQRTDRDFSKTATLGEVLQPAGYRTLWSGKHHAEFDPTTRGFDKFEGFLGGAINFWHPGATARQGEKEPRRITHYRWVIDGKEVPEFIPQKGWYSTDGFTDWAIDWLKEDTDSDKPFFLYVAYNAPHWPLHAHPKDIAKYDRRYDAGYAAVRKARYLRQVVMGILDSESTGLPDDPLAAAWESLSAEQKQLEADRMEIHAAMVDRMDQNIGRLIDTLKANGQFENTLILFLADNGASPERTNRARLGDGSGPIGGVNSYECIGRNWAHVCNTPLRLYKATSHEGGINTPMIAHWPKGISNPGSTFREPCHLIDVVPTITELTGATYPGSSKEPDIPAPDGISLSPSFAGKSLARTKPLFFEFGSGRAIRDGDWKLVTRGKSNWELYDFNKDRNETNNLAAEHPEKVATLSKAWNDWYQGATGSAYGKKGKGKKGKP